MAECDMAWGNCLMATAGYTKFQAQTVMSFLQHSYFVESQQYAVECV